jgi:hypothetical protein
MHDDGRDADDDTFDSVEASRTARLREGLTRSWLAWVFVVLAAGFVGWYVRFQALPTGASTAAVAIHILQLVPSVCAILVPAALLARHPDAPSLAGTLLAGTVLFALVQGMIVLANSLQPTFVDITPPDPDLLGVVPLQAVYNGLVSVVLAFALGSMAFGLVDARRYEDDVPAWLTGWFVPAAAVFGGLIGVIDAQNLYADTPISPPLAVYIAATIILGALRMIVWAYLVATTSRGAMAGEEPSAGWILAAIGAAMVTVALVLVNLNNVLDFPSQDAATWFGYVTVVAYAVGNVVLLAAFAIGLPVIPGPGDDGVEDFVAAPAPRR